MIPHRIVAMGSSSLFGVGDPGEGGFIGRLKKWHEGMDIRNYVYNLGIPGDTTSGMLERLSSEVRLRKPDLILISTGLNDTRRVGKKDASNTTPIHTFKKNLLKLIGQAKAFAEVVFIGVYPIDERRTAPLRYWQKEYFYLLSDASKYEAVTKELCLAKDIPYIDNFSEWVGEDYLPWLHEDGLHANAEGHERLFQKLRETLCSMYNQAL